VRVPASRSSSDARATIALPTPAVLGLTGDAHPTDGAGHRAEDRREDRDWARTAKQEGAEHLTLGVARHQDGGVSVFKGSEPFKKVTASKAGTCAWSWSPDRSIVGHRTKGQTTPRHKQQMWEQFVHIVTARATGSHGRESGYIKQRDRNGV
jgi:hypothetical protein